jgi:flagellar hook-associated protein 2
MAATASVSGVISGLDTDGIISKMVAFAGAPIKILQSKQAKITTQLAAWQDTNTRLLALKVKADALTSPISFQNKTVSSSDDDLLGVTANVDATPGSYAVTVNRIAQAEQRQSQGYLDTTSTQIGTGSVTVGVGSAAKSITLDSTNNTLAGLKDAINRADVGVTASIVDLGSGSTHDYHLQLTGKSTGASSSITWNPTLAGGTAPAWTTLTAAQDSMITVGPVGNTTTITKSSNTINDVYPGLTFNLKGADAGKQVTVAVSADTSGVKDKIKGFVDQYNDVMDFINDQFSFDPETNTSGTLFGDFTLQGIQQDLRNKVLAVIPGLPAGMNTLSQIGITSDTKDHLILNETDLDQALSSNPDGVMKLFANTGQTTDFSVSYLGVTNATKDTGGSSGYRVRVDQVATQTRVTAGAAQTSNLAADETLTVNGTGIHLTAGMTPQQVVDEINKNSATTGVSASRTLADGSGAGDYLTLTRVAYGSGQGITAVSNVTNGGGAPQTDTSGVGKQQVSEMLSVGETGTGTGKAGQNVAGAFGVTVNGVTTWEPTTGVGQILTGKTGNANTEGLRVKAASTSTGEHGQITVSRGIAGVLSGLMSFLTSKQGAVTTTEDSLNKQISDLQDEVTTQNARISDYEDHLRNQFSLMEGQLGTLQSQGNYLSAQLGALNKSSK